MECFVPHFLTYGQMIYCALVLKIEEYLYGRLSCYCPFWDSDRGSVTSQLSLFMHIFCLPVWQQYLVYLELVLTYYMVACDIWLFCLLLIQKDLHCVFICWKQVVLISGETGCGKTTQVTVFFSTFSFISLKQFNVIWQTGTVFRETFWRCIL